MTHYGCERGTTRQPGTTHRPASGRDAAKPDDIIFKDERSGKSYKRGAFVGKVKLLSI